MLARFNELLQGHAGATSADRKAAGTEPKIGGEARGVEGVAFQKESVHGAIDGH